jgi:hypothetical protein
MLLFGWLVFRGERTKASISTNGLAGEIAHGLA